MPAWQRAAKSGNPPANAPINRPMNSRIDTQGRVSLLERQPVTTPAIKAEPALGKGQLVPQGPRPVVQSGPFKGLDAMDVEAAGLNTKKWIGLEPVAAELKPGIVNSVLRRALTGVARGLFSRVYDVQVDKDDRIATDIAMYGPIKGALVLLTSHTGLDDPGLVYSRIAPYLPCRPVGTEGLFTDQILKAAFKAAGAFSVPETTTPLGIKSEIDLLAVQISSALRRGENVGLHPSGRLIVGNQEIIGSKSLIQRVLELMPDARLISVNTEGMNGSHLSHAGKHHYKTSFVSDILHNLKHPWQTGFKLVKQRRMVDIEIRDVTEAFKAEKGTVAQNQVLEKIANRPHKYWGVPNPAIHVPIRGDDKSGEYVYPAEAPKQAASTNVIVDPTQVAEITASVIAHIAKLAKVEESSIKATDHLAYLDIDSLALHNDVIGWVNKTFERNFLTPEGFTTVQDVIDGATGVLSATAGIEWKDVSDAYVKQIAETGTDAIPAESRSIVDSFVKQLMQNPKRIVAVDEVVGEYTFEDLAVLVGLLLPEMRKIPGEHVGLLFPNSVASTAIQLALGFAGKSSSMLNAQWNDQQSSSAMSLAGVDAILTAQGALRALKGKKEMDDAERVAKGTLTPEQVANDPTNTPFPTIEEKFIVIESFLRQIPLMRVLDKGVLRKNKLKRDLLKIAEKLNGANETANLFTSGSTGNPKGISYRHEQVMQSCNALAKAFQLQTNDVLLHLAPSFHLVGFTAGNMANMLGITTVNVPNPRQPAIAAELCKRRGATITVGTPSLLNAVAKAAGPNGLPMLTRIVVGAEPLTPDIEANLRKAAPNAQIIQGYGMTETGVTFVERFDPKNADDRSLGEPLEGVEYKLVDPSDLTREVKQGEDGIMLVRGPAVVTPELGFMGETPEDAFTKLDGKDWFVTGDIVREKVIEDAEGVSHTVVKFIDRASRFSKINGERIGHNTLEPPIAALLPEPADGGPRVFVVEGPMNDAGQPTLVAYAVPGRDKDGKATDKNGQPLTYEVVRNALADAFNNDPKFNVAEVRLVQSIELLGTGKVALSLYKKAGKQPHDGETLKR